MTLLLIFFLILSLVINVILVWYTKIILRRYYFASEFASEIFARLDAFKVHLKDIFELELFYGDRNLKEIIEHTKNLIDFLKKYENVYSFTQPNLEELLREAESKELIQPQEIK